MKRFLTVSAGSILIAFLFVPAYRAQIAGPDDKGPNDATKFENKEYAGTYQSLPAITQNTLNKPPSEKESQNHSDDSAGNSPEWIQDINAFSTAVIAAFTIALFVAVLVQVWTSRAIERAWVIVDIKHEDKELTDTTIIEDVISETTSIPLTCISLNGGRSPAWVIEKRIGFEIFENPEAVPETPPLCRTRIFDDIPHAVYAKEHSVKADMPVAQGRLNVTNVGVIYGAIRYRDIFKKVRTTTFGYRVLPVAGKLSLRLQPLKHRPKYNQYT